MATGQSASSLRLVRATAQHILIALEGGEKLARLLAAQPHAQWPPAGVDDATLRSWLDHLHRGPEHVQWGIRFVVQLNPGTRGTLVGFARFEHPPVAGVTRVHCGACDPAVLPQALTAALDWAFEHDDTLVRIEAQGGASGLSAGLLDSQGFEETGTGEAPVYAKDRASWMQDGPPSRRCLPLQVPPDSAEIEGMPGVAAEVFQELMAEPLRETSQTRDAVQAYVAFIEAESKNNPSVELPLAQDIARVCEGLLDAIRTDTPEHARRQIQAAARYFVTEADGDSDLDIGGLDEDAAVANAIAEHLGRGDLVSGDF